MTSVGIIFCEVSLNLIFLIKIDFVYVSFHLVIIFSLDIDLE